MRVSRFSARLLRSAQPSAARGHGPVGAPGTLAARAPSPFAGITAQNERSHPSRASRRRRVPGGALCSAAGVTAALSPVIAAAGLREVSPTSRHAAFALQKVTQLIMYRAQVQRFLSFFFPFCSPSKPKASCTPRPQLVPVFLPRTQRPQAAVLVRALPPAPCPAMGAA